MCCVFNSFSVSVGLSVCSVSAILFQSLCFSVSVCLSLSLCPPLSPLRPLSPSVVRALVSPSDVADVKKNRSFVLCFLTAPPLHPHFVSMVTADAAGLFS